jgi:hypothetical protein
MKTLPSRFAITLGIMLNAGCWLQVAAQSPDRPAHYVYFDNFLGRGHFPLSPDSLGDVYFERMGPRKDSRYATLHVAGQAIGSGYIPADTSGSITCIDLDAGKLRTFSRSYAWGYSEVWFRKNGTSSKPWRFERWSHFTREKVTTLTILHDTPFRRIRQLRPQADGRTMEMPDTSRMHFQYQCKTYQYQDTVLEWTHTTWDVDRRNPRKVTRQLESQYVWRYRLPRPDPDHVMGPWGHSYAARLGELVAHYNRHDALSR